jgi:hypothetical protein
MWRSPVAYLAGGQVVAGSNPVIPTSTKVFHVSETLFLFSKADKNYFVKFEKIKKEVSAAFTFVFPAKI